MPFLLAEILNFQGSTHRIGVGSFSYLIEEGVDISCVQQILGHSSIKTTQIYIHVAAKRQAEILRELHPRNRMNILRVA